MAKTYLMRIDDEETWRRFHSLCALRGCSIKDALWTMITEFIRNQREGDEPKKPTKKGGK